jgi:predicted AAA+ superfamily ATPase
MNKYLPRLIEKKIEIQMNVVGAILIEGPKWCGKLTTATLFAKTVIKLQDPNIFMQYKGYSGIGRVQVLDGEKPMLFDEWQKLPNLWDMIRVEVDENNKKGIFLLTGSAKPLIDKNRHSGVGRFAKIVMRPMSLYESGESTGEVSLEKLFNNEEVGYGKSKLTFEELIFIICRGGWPEAVLAKEEYALEYAYNYYQLLVEEDIFEEDKLKRNIERAKLVLKSYARNISSLANLKTLQDDCIFNDETLDQRTLNSYLETLENLFVIEEIPAWNPKLRSKTSIRSNMKRQFVDASIAAVSINATPSNLIKDINTLGLLFECLATRDLRIYAESIDGKIYYYRDYDNLEVDIIIELRDGKWAGIEIKLGDDKIEEAVTNLKKLEKKVLDNKPAFLMVLTGLPYSYKREDGIYVVGISTLKN